MFALFISTLALQVASAGEDNSFVSFGVQSWVNETRWGEMMREVTGDSDEPPETIPLNTLALRMTYSQHIKDDWYIQAALNVLDMEVDPRALQLSGLVGWNKMILSNEKSFWRAAVTPFGQGEYYGDDTDMFEGAGYYLISGPPRSEKVIVKKVSFSSTSLLFRPSKGWFQNGQVGPVFDKVHDVDSVLHGFGIRFLGDDYLEALMVPKSLARHLSKPCSGIGQASNVCMSLDYRMGVWRPQPSALSYATNSSSDLIPYLEARMQAFVFLSNPYRDSIVARIGAGVTPSVNGPASFMTQTVWATTPEVFFDMGGRF